MTERTGRFQRSGYGALYGRVLPRPGEPALPPEEAKPTIKDSRQYDLVDAVAALNKPKRKPR